MTISNKVFLITPLILALSTTAFASDIRNGQALYKQNCMFCHGINGQPTMAGAANFKRGEGLFQSDQQLLERIKNGKRACPSFRGILTEQKIFDVIAYLRTFFQ